MFAAPVPKWRWLPPSAWGLCRRLITCWVPAQSPIPSCSEAEPPWAARLPLLSILFQAKVLCFSICQSKDLLLMSWLILTFNTDSHRGERQTQFSKVAQLITGCFQEALCSLLSFLPQPGLRDWDQGSQVGVLRGLLVPLGVGSQLQSALVQFTTLGVMELGPGAWCCPALTHWAPPGKAFNTRLWYLSLHCTLHQKGSRGSQWSYLWSTCT